MRSTVFGAACAALALSACGERQAPSALAGAPADPDAWVIDYDRSRLEFTATQAGQSFRGRFDTFETRVRFDPDALDDFSVEVVVDMKSARTGDRQRDQALPTADWFDAREYPTARFVAGDAARTGPNAYEAQGTLSLRETSRDLPLAFTVDIDGRNAHARGSTMIVRTDFGVGRGEFVTDEWVCFEVNVSFEIFASRPD
jgi:polyisoprenoid-binding protein YceI